MSKEKIEKIIDDILDVKMKKTKGENPDVSSHRGGYNERVLENWEEKEKIKEVIFNKILPEVLKELIDNKSLMDESNGRYNRECELRKKIKKLYNIEL